MAQFQIIPANDYSAAALTTDKVETVFSIVQQLDGREADVLADGLYAFTIRIAENGFFTLFQRQGITGWEGLTHER